MSTHPRPLLPDVDDELHGPFWAGTRAGQLRVQRCPGCRRLHWPPRWRCAACGSAELSWEAVDARGELFSWVVAHHPFFPVLAERVPYAVGIVALAGVPGVRFLGGLVDVDPAALRAGLPLEAVFEAVTPEVTLVNWRPVAG